MSDDIRKRQDSSETADSEITTADLAGSSQRPLRTGLGERRTEADPQSANSDRPPAVGEASRKEVVATSGTGAASATGAATAPAMERETGPLFASSEASELRRRWDAIQVGFVDEPRKAVEEADTLVAGTMKRLAEIFAEERNKLENQWDKGENVSTEDLRLALRRYRSFFSRLLSV
jgi:hypothetical protein